MSDSPSSPGPKAKPAAEKPPDAKPKSFPRLTLAIVVLSSIVGVAGYVINKRNAELTFLRDAEDRDTLIRVTKGNVMAATNRDIVIDRVRITLPRPVVIGVGHSITTGMTFPESELLQMLHPRLVEIAERTPDYKGCLIDVPMLFTFHGTRKGETRRYAQVYIARVSADKLTGAWRFFVGEVFSHGKILAASREAIEEKYLDSLLPKMQIIRSHVTTDGKIP